MLQRLQTIYFLLSGLSLGLLFLFPVIEFSSNQAEPNIGLREHGSMLNYKVYAFEETADNPSTPTFPDYQVYFIANTLIISTSILLTLLSIALYKNRKIQLLICWIAIICMLISAILIYLKIDPDKIVSVDRHVGIGSFALSVALILTLFARRNIRKDEDLVRSADRLR